MEDKSTTELLRAISNVQQAIPPLPKEGVNPFHSSTYVTLDTVLAYLKPELEKNGLVVTQTQTSEDNKIGLTTTVWHIETGAFLTDTIYVEVGEKGQYIQEVGKELTYLRRYGLSSLFMLATEDDNDGNPHKKPAPKPKNVKDKLRERAIEYKDEKVTDKQRGMLAGMLEMCFTDEQEKNRKIFMDMIWDKTSVKDLTAGEVKATLDFLRISEGMPDQVAIGEVMKITREGI
jgi:hypothetical protein